MPKKAVFLFTILTLITCFLSYKLGSSPVALAKSRPSQEAGAGAAPPPLPAAPATWALENHAGNMSGLVSVTKPAGGTGVQHVATCVSATYWNDGAPAGTGEQVTLMDGSNTLLVWNLAAPSGASNSVYLCGLNVVGTANTAMTLEIGDVTNAFVTVDLVGYDAQ